MTRYTVHFTGHVQGVGFRFTAQRVARGHDIAGYVQNLPDGRVRLVAEGEPGVLDEFLGELKQAMGRHIRSVDIIKDNATGEFGRPGEGLTVRH